MQPAAQIGRAAGHAAPNELALPRGAGLLACLVEAQLAPANGK